MDKRVICDHSLAYIRRLRLFQRRFRAVSFSSFWFSFGFCVFWALLDLSLSPFVSVVDRINGLDGNLFLESRGVLDGNCPFPCNSEADPGNIYNTIMSRYFGMEHPYFMGIDFLIFSTEKKGSAHSRP
ncbi:hypothetical protein NPIL_273771 [Nephila pilipes]|uniref:Uncharacterized protein n=1 Tax=Nephila pilipes TaxID=299642 RepID=A0A8X6Q4B1_NEPPI|nr:hypothetical protein NPIL_273771 [Nephila pilipes]